MATTRIWPVRDNLKRVLEYAENHLKTANPAHYTPEEMRDLFDVLEYAKNGEKTERERFVTGIRCNDKTAFAQMMLTKQRFGKMGGNLAYHAYQSFPPEEVTPKQCHAIGVELARRLWGDRFEVLVTTHLNTNCVHNHFVINSVSFSDGKKFNNNYAMYFSKFRKLSDEICREKGLSVIENPGGRTPRSIYFAEKNGEPTKYNLMREAVDKAIQMSMTMEQFRRALRKLGYEIGRNPNRKYPTIRSVNSPKATRLYHLGEAYLPESISQRIFDHPLQVSKEYEVLTHPERHRPPVNTQAIQLKGSFKAMKKVTGLRALYLHYCFLLGVIPKNNPRRSLSPEMRAECRRLDGIVKQTKLLGSEKIGTFEELLLFKEKIAEQIQRLEIERSKISNRIRRCSDAEQEAVLKDQRKAVSAQLKPLREQLRTAGQIEERSTTMRQNIRIEQQMRAEAYGMQTKNQKKERGLNR